MRVEMFKNIVYESINTVQENNNTRLMEKPLQKVEEEKKLQRESPLLRDEQLKDFTEKLNEFFGTFNLETKLVYHKEYQIMVVQVTRKDTGELIKQIPPEELLEVYKRIREFAGILLRDQA